MNKQTRKQQRRRRRRSFKKKQLKRRYVVVCVVVVFLIRSWSNSTMCVCRVSDSPLNSHTHCRDFRGWSLVQFNYWQADPLFHCENWRPCLRCLLQSITSFFFFNSLFVRSQLFSEWNDDLTTIKQICLSNRRRHFLERHAEKGGKKTLDLSFSTFYF